MHIGNVSECRPAEGVLQHRWQLPTDTELWKGVRQCEKAVSSGTRVHTGNMHYILMCLFTAVPASLC